MAKKPTDRQRFEQLLDQFEPEFRKAFEEAVNDLRSKADLKRVIEALERQNLSAAVEALNLDPAAFASMDRVIRSAYGASGLSAIAAVPVIRAASGARLVIRFDGRAPRAERWVSTRSSTLITSIADDIRLAARNALLAGLEAGNNPRQTALSLVGRLDRTTGRRVGGTLGLTSTQEAWARTAYQDLLSGDADRLRHYLTLNRRDRRFDRTVLAAIRDGRALDVATASRMIGRLSDSYLALRGETVARTETLTALNAARREAFEQVVDQGIRRENIKKYWSTTRDGRTRDTHAAMQGQEVGIDEPFVSPSGAQLMYPGDSSLGAGPAEVIQCRCYHGYRISQFVEDLE